MKRFLAASGVVLVTAPALLALSVPAAGLPRGTKVQTFQRVPYFPVDMAWVPGSRTIFFTEKNTGKIRIIRRGRLLGAACVDLEVDSQGERGALGLTLHPDYEDNHRLYVYYTKASPLENRVERFTVRDNRCRDRRVIVRGIDASSSGYHNGGQLEFVGRKLFVTTGESHDPARAQDRDNRSGKVLRVRADGSIPKSNPFNRPGDRNPVWTLGHRNPFGLAQKPGTRRLYETENGPDCDDELNRIRKGRNYGWGPGYRCGTAGVGRNPKRPLRRWTPPIVPTDPWWYRGRMRRLSGDLYMGDFRDGRLHRFELNGKGSRVVGHSVVTTAGAIVDVSKGPGRWLYFMTPSAILRIVPR
jgi:glucose/arabinose dehydrogenase